MYVVERLLPKSFRQRKLTATGEWEWNLDGCPRLLYRQNKLAKAIADNRWVFFVEGERDVQTLESHGFVGTTCSGGGAGWRDEFAEQLTGAKVAVVPDNDGPGRRLARNVAASIVDRAKDVRYIELPGVPEKADVSFFLNGHGGTAEQLKQLVNDAPSYLPTPTTTLGQVKRRDIEWLWQDRIPKGMFTILAGVQGEGKSHLALSCAAALSNGGGLPGITRPADSLLITYEDDPASVIRPRAERMGADLDRIHIWDARMEPFDVNADIPRLQALLRARPEIELIVLDPLVSGLGLDDAYRETEVRSKLMKLLSLGKTVVGLMHLTKAVDASLLYRVGGSVAFTALARSVLRQGDGYISVIKSNVAGHSRPVKYELRDERFILHEGRPLDSDPRSLLHTAHSS